MVTRPTSKEDAPPRDELGELDSLVSNLVAEMNEAADEITRVMRADDDDEAAASEAVSTGQALSDNGALESRDDAPAADGPSSVAGATEAEPVDASSSTGEVVDDAELSAENIDAALADVASRLQEDMDRADESARALSEELEKAAGLLEEPARDEAPAPSDDPGTESIAAQIDEELARAFREETEAVAPPDADDEAPAPEAAQAPAPPDASDASEADDALRAQAAPVTPEPAAEASGVEEDEAVAEGHDDEPPVSEEADATAEDAVNAVAETIDKLLDAPDDEHAPRAVAVTDEDVAEHSASAPEDEDEDEHEVESASPAAPAPVAAAQVASEDDADDEPEPDDAAPAPVAPKPAKAPAKSSKPPAPPAPPGSAEPPAPPAPGEVAPSRRRIPLPALASVGGALASALVLVNAPLLKLPRQLRDTLGLAGLVTLFNAACLWVFLLLR